MGKVQLTHSHKSSLRSRTRVRILRWSREMLFLFFLFVLFLGEDKLGPSFLWLFFTSQSRNVVYRGWPVSSECSQCCREMVSVSRGKFSGQAAESKGVWGGGKGAPLSHDQTDKSSRETMYTMVVAHRQKCFCLRNFSSLSLIWEINQSTNPCITCVVMASVSKLNSSGIRSRPSSEVDLRESGQVTH